MKRIVIVLGAILFLAVTTLLVAPSFIDWSNYRTTFETQLANATGRQVEINGDVSLTLLPRPTLQVENVRIANPAGASTPDFARAERVAVNLAFGPLLRGRLQFISIEIIDPVISAEVMPDGSVTWDMSVRDVSSNRSGPQTGRSERNTRAPFNLGIDVLRIVNGTIIYQDDQRGIKQELTALTVDLAAESTTGPFDAVGDLTIYGMPWQFETSLGVLRRDRPGALVVVLSNSDADLTFDVVGSLTLADTGPVIAGRFIALGSDAVSSLNALGVVQPDQAMPTELRKNFQLESRFDFRGATVFSDNLTLRWGNTIVDGTGWLDWEDETEFKLDLGINRLDLEAWQFASFAGPDRFATLRSFFMANDAHAQTSPPKFSVPANINGTIDLTINLIEWQGKLMRNGHVNVSLADAQLNVTEASLSMPGNASLDFAGNIGSDSGSPNFDLTGSASSHDLRSLLEWLDLAPSPGVVPPSRLNFISGSTRLTGTPSQLQFQDIDVVLDTTRVGGSVVVVPGSPVEATLDLTASSLDLDSYLPALSQQFGLMTTIGTSDGDSPDMSEEPAGNSQPNFFSVANVNLKLSVGSVTVGRNVYGNVGVEGSIQNGAVTIDKATIDDMAGARISISGRVDDAFSTPHAQNLQMSITAEDFALMHRTLNLNLPRSDVLTGPMTLDGTLSGSIDEVALDLNLTLNAIAGEVKGTITDATSTPVFDLSVAATHNDYRSLLSALNLYTATDFEGEHDAEFSASVAGSFTALQLNDIKLRMGDNALSGVLHYDEANVRPQVTGNIALATVNVDRLFVPDPTSALTRSSLSRSAGSETSVSGRWSSDPIDLSSMNDFDADVTVTADRVVMRGLDVDQLLAEVKLSSGVLSVINWGGNLYGGPASGDFTLNTVPAIDVHTSLVVTDAAMSRLGGSLTGSEQADGKFALRGHFTAQGNSQRDLVMSLAGDGVLAATGIDANMDGEGWAFTTVLAPIRAISQLGGVFTGGVTEGLASMGTEFSGEKGVFTLSNASLQSNVYAGEFSGTVDLPRWWVDAEGRVSLKVNVITQLLGTRLQMPSLIPVSVEGPLDLPNVTMNRGGTGENGQATDTASPAQSSPLQQNPAQLLQGILNEFTKPR